MKRSEPNALSSVLGQDIAVHTLRRGLTQGTVHHAFLFEGPAGVGKERAAFGLAQALVCERRGTEGLTEACGACSACARALPASDTRMPLHPDVVVLETALYPPDRIGRRTPETTEISIDQVRALVLSRAMFGPHEGRAKVFIVRRADELSMSAANALLKTLEEPLDRTHFILLCDERPLLATIRSRTLRVRFRPLPDALLVQILGELGHPNVAPAVVFAAGGSVVRALARLDAAFFAANEAFYSAWRDAVSAPSLERALALAEAEKKEKSIAIAKLEHALVETAAEVRAAALEGDDHATREKLAVYDVVAQALAKLDRNASTQLTFEAALLDAREASRA